MWQVHICWIVDYRNKDLYYDFLLWQIPFLYAIYQIGHGTNLEYVYYVDNDINSYNLTHRVGKFSSFCIGENMSMTFKFRVISSHFHLRITISPD